MDDWRSPSSQDAIQQMLARDGRCLDPCFALPQLQPYSSSAPDGMVAVGILERAIDRQALGATSE
jgi:hypothetical protein